MNSVAIVHPRLAAASFERAIRPLLAAPEKFEKVGITLVTFSFPFLDVELHWRLYGITLRLRIDGTDFPYRPVGGWWIDNNDQLLLPGSDGVPSGNGFHIADQSNVSSCWFCFKGWREYHNHSSHQDLSWASIRSDSRYGVLQMIMQLNKDLNSHGVTKV